MTLVLWYIVNTWEGLMIYSKHLKKKKDEFCWSWREFDTGLMIYSKIDNIEFTFEKKKRMDCDEII